MPALTIRNLPDAVHASLRERAARESLSVEALVRRILAEAATEPQGGKDKPVAGFGEASAPFVHADAHVSTSAAQKLWGALTGSVRVAQGVDLTAPAGEVWSAEA